MKICFLFPGYGSQYLGMGKELYDNFRIVQEFFEEASNCLNVNFVRLCFASSEAELTKIENAFVSIFLIHSSISALLQQEQIKPDIVIGHDLGDYAALHTAGGITVPDALYLLTKYAQFYHLTLNSTNVKALEITGLPVSIIKELCNQVSNEQMSVSIAIYYNQYTFVVSGNSFLIDVIAKKACQLDAQVKPYLTGGGLYSTLMSPVVKQLKMYVEKVDFNDVATPLIMNMYGKPVVKGSEIKQRFFEQLALPVFFDKTMQKMRDSDIIIQIGTKNDLTNRIVKKYPHKQVLSITKLSDIQKLKQSIVVTNSRQSTRNGKEHGAV